MRRPATWLIGALAALAASVALAEGFPDRSLEQLEAADLSTTRQQSKTPKAGDLFFNPGDDGGARAQAVYTGQSRPLGALKQSFLAAFASSVGGNEGYATLYRREFLFQSNGKAFWMPVQSQVADYFAKELKVGAMATLYVRNAGGFRTDKGWEWVFLVEEFDGPGDPQKSPPPGAPKRPAIPPGPKQAT